VHIEYYMFAEYIQAALRNAKYEPLEDGTYMATVAGLQGVIAVVDTIEECRDDLIGAIEGWVGLGLRLGDPIPLIDGIDINVSVESMPIVE
jgi:predicted RNase H-like HicB family nuclease